MTARNLANFTISELTSEFVRLAIAKGEAIMGDQTTKASRIYWQMNAIEEELKSRNGDQRRILSTLFQHPDPSVRLEAATATLAILPAASRQVLKSIWDRDEFPFAGDAGMRLHHLETGFFKPI